MSANPSQDSRNLVSVIMPVYNCAEFIAASVDSVLNQDYPHFELLVVDDGSTDDTRDVLASYGNRIRVLSQENQGAAAARNLGMAMADGAYLCFLDSDDIWHRQKLSLQVEYLEAHPEVGVVCCDWQVWNAEPDGSFVMPSDFDVPLRAAGPDPKLCGWVYPEMLLESAMHTIAVMFRREIIEQLGNMKTDLVNGEDYDYWLRASRITQIHKLLDVAALYRIREGSLVRTVHERNYELEVLQNALDRWGRRSPDGREQSRAALRKRLASLHLNFAYMHYHHGDPAVAARSSVGVIRNRPFFLRGWKYGVMSFVKQFFRKEDRG